jgi:hypothetical protein
MTGPTIIIRTTKAKAVVAAIGTTATAVTTALATVSVAVGDDAIDVSEVGVILTAVASLVSTVYGVWKTTNRRIPNTRERL